MSEWALVAVVFASGKTDAKITKDADLHVVLKRGSLVLGVECLPCHFVSPVLCQPHRMILL